MQRSIALAMLLSSWTMAASAQGVTDPGTLTLEPVRSGPVFAPDFKVTDVDGRTATLLGGRIGYVIDDTLFVGFGAFFQTNRTSLSRLDYGGGIVDWKAYAGNTASFSIGALVGGGGSTLGRDVQLPIRRHRFPPRRGDEVPQTQTVRVGVDRGFFAFEPHANLRLSVRDWLRASVGASYRFVGWAGDDFNEALRGPAATFSLQFGVF